MLASSVQSVSVGVALLSRGGPSALLSPRGGFSFCLATVMDLVMHWHFLNDYPLLPWGRFSFCFVTVMDLVMRWRFLSDEPSSARPSCSLLISTSSPPSLSLLPTLSCSPADDSPVLSSLWRSWSTESKTAVGANMCTGTSVFGSAQSLSCLQRHGL